MDLCCDGSGPETIVTAFLPCCALDASFRPNAVHVQFKQRFSHICTGGEEGSK